MWIVRLALSRPYTFIVMALVIILLTPVVLLRTPTDIFPEINIPVIAVAFVGGWFLVPKSKDPDEARLDPVGALLSIVGISSELALLGDEDHVPYVAAKSAMIGLVRSVAREYGPDQVRVNIICPGPTDTEMLTDRWRGEDYRHSIPLDRFGTPEELARAIVDVAEWTWLTGQVISPNGGVVIQ